MKSSPGSSLWILLAVLVLTRSAVDVAAFYLPGSYRHKYLVGDPLSVKVNSLTSINTAVNQADPRREQPHGHHSSNSLTGPIPDLSAITGLHDNQLRDNDLHLRASGEPSNRRLQLISLRINRRPSDQSASASTAAAPTTAAPSGTTVNSKLKLTVLPALRTSLDAAPRRLGSKKSAADFRYVVVSNPPTGR